MTNSIEHDGHSSHWDDSPCQRKPVNNYEKAILMYKVDKVQVAQSTKDATKMALERIDSAIEAINKTTHEIKVMESKIAWNAIELPCDPYKGMNGDWRGD